MSRCLCVLALVGFAGVACGEVQRNMMTADASPDDASVDAAPGDTPAIDAMPYVCQAVSPVGGVPDTTSKPGWELSPGGQASNDSGTSPPVLVLGDSLVFNVDVQVMANVIRFFRGTDAVVAAAAGAGVAHFNKESLIRSANLSTLAQYAAFLGSLRITVLALGSNDARLITRERQQTGGYSVDELAHQLDVAIATALARSQCVLLVNIADHWNAVAPDVATQVNGVLGCASAASERVHLADWSAHSASHPEWFASPTDIHHSEAGKTAYRDFISDAIAIAIAAGC